MRENTNQTARLATLERIAETVVANFLDPVPTPDTLRAIFDRENVPRFKANPLARRGGGIVYYSVSAVEKLFRAKLLPGTVASIRAREVGGCQ